MNPHDTLPPDNYAAFLSRLDTATTSLSARARSLDKALTAVSLLLEPYQSAVRQWERRRVHVSEQLARHSRTPQAYAALSELYDMAAKMESMLRNRAQRVTEKMSVMQGHRDAIEKSLRELELSRAKLKLSRRLAQDRENLSRAFSELAGSTGAAATIPDLGLRSDLKEAREAVILAEALMEVKGP
jgi:chromosome segregation ATPase